MSREQIQFIAGQAARIAKLEAAGKEVLISAEHEEGEIWSVTALDLETLRNALSDPTTLSDGE